MNGQPDHHESPEGREARGLGAGSVGVHLDAVAAHVAALEARVKALEAERDNLKEQLAGAAATNSGDQVAARLLASRLAMEGKSREMILMSLAAEHDIADPAVLVDDVLARLD